MAGSQMFSRTLQDTRFSAIPSRSSSAVFYILVPFPPDMVTILRVTPDEVSRVYILKNRHTMT